MLGVASIAILRVFSRFVIGVTGAGVVAVGCWALQASTLPSPTSADRVAARATFWLQRHRLVLDSFRVDRTDSSGACLRGWFSDGGGPRRRGSLFAERRSVWLVAGLRRRISLLRGRFRPAGWAVLKATLGCSRGLQDLLIGGLRGGDLGAERSTVAGQAAVALRLPRLGSRWTLAVRRRAVLLHLPHLQEERLTLYVAQRTARPLLAVAVLNGRQISARLSLAANTAAALSRVGLRRLAQRLGDR